MEFQERKPGEMMQDLVMIATKGTLQKHGSDPVPVVKRVPPNDNSLLRGWEYTVATMGSRAENSDKKKKLEIACSQGFAGLDLKTPLRNTYNEKDRNYKSAQTLRKNQQDIYNVAVNEYNRLVKLYNTDNQRYEAEFERAKRTYENEKVKYERLDQAFNVAFQERETAVEKYNALDGLQNDLEVASRDVLVFTYDPLLDRGSTSSDGSSSKGGWVAADKSGNPVTNQSQYQACLIESLVAAAGTRASRSQIEGWVRNPKFMEKMMESFPSPWRSATGGMHEPSKQVLSGKKNETKGIADDKPGNAEQLLKNFVKGLKDITDPTVTLGVEGIHSMRGLPQHESLKQLKGSSDPETMVQQIFEQSKRKANSPLDLDQQSYLHRQLMDKLGRTFFNRKVNYTLPTTAQTPAQFIVAAMNGLGPLARQYFSPPEVAEEQVKNLVEGFVAEELYGESQFVLADTNWGDGTEKYLHVIAPDPKTGEPKFYRKGMYGGDLLEQEANWLDKKWEYTMDVA